MSFVEDYNNYNKIYLREDCFNNKLNQKSQDGALLGIAAESLSTRALPSPVLDNKVVQVVKESSLELDGQSLSDSSSDSDGVDSDLKFQGLETPSSDGEFILELDLPESDNDRAWFESQRSISNEEEGEFVLELDLYTDSSETNEANLSAKQGDSIAEFGEFILELDLYTDSPETNGANLSAKQDDSIAESGEFILELDLDASLVADPREEAIHNHELGACIQVNRQKWQEKAARKGKSLFIRAGSIPGLHRSVIIHHQSVLVLCNQKRTLGDELLGEGTFKVVTAAYDFDTGKRYASAGLKLDATSETAQEERNQLYRVQHLGGFTRLVCDATYPCKKTAGKTKMRLIMELAESGDLHKVIENGTLSKEEKLLATRQLLKALANLHGDGLIHRDLKPANILQSQSEGTLIADVGSVCGSDDADRKKDIVGTPLWMTPEYASAILLAAKKDPQLPSDGLAKTVTDKGDVWAIGVILYQLWYGIKNADLPWYASDVKGVFTALAENSDYFEQRFPEGSMDSIAILLRGMLRATPSDRISAQVASAMADQLDLTQI